MDWLVKGLIGLGGMVIASLVTKEVTGKHIHGHALEWWQKTRDELAAWAREHQHERILAFVVTIDGVVSSVARLKFTAKTRRGTVVVKEEELSTEEAAELFPELRRSPSMDITEMVLHG